MATRQKNTGTDAATDETATPAETDAVDTKADTTAADTQAATDAPSSTLAEPAAAGMTSEADAPAATAEEDRTGKVPIKLANPIDNPEHQRRLRLTVKEGGYQVHDVIWVTPDDASALITAGLAQVDPEDKAAVSAALRGEHDGMTA